MTAVIVVNDVGAEHVDENSGDQMAPWSYMFTTSRAMSTDPDVMEVEPLKVPSAPEMLNA